MISCLGVFRLPYSGANLKFVGSYVKIAKKLASGCRALLQVEPLLIIKLYDGFYYFSQPFFKFIY